MEETWKVIKDYEGLYEVSNTGLVRLLGRKKRHRTGKLMDIKPKILSQFNVLGYSKVKLRDYDGSTKMHSVHRLVANAFIPNPNNYPQVNHKDENPSNNCVDNLEWCTPKYNTNYGTGILRCSVKRMRPVVQMSMNGEIIDTWPGIKFAANALGLQSSSISLCCNGKRIKSTGGYKWKYLSNI